MRVRAAGGPNTPPDDEQQPTKEPPSTNAEPGFRDWLRDEWEDFQTPKEEGTIKDAVLMGTSLALYVYVAMELYRAYAKMYSLSGMKTISEALSSSSF